MSGREMEALASGLMESTEFDYLNARISQVAYLGGKITDYGIPVVKPYGGHAIYVDAKSFFPQIPQIQYPAQVLGVELYIESGVREWRLEQCWPIAIPSPVRNVLPAWNCSGWPFPGVYIYKQSHGHRGLGIKTDWDKRESYKA